MIREYKTIQEVAGPLMLVNGVEGVTYGELGEIQLPNGDVRRCKLLEVEGSNVLVQLFESSSGINLANSKVRFLGHGHELGIHRHARRVFDGLGRPATTALNPPDKVWILTTANEPAARTTRRIHSDRVPLSTDQHLVADRSCRSSGSGLPLLTCGSDRRQAKVFELREPFAVVFAAIAYL